MERLFWMCVSGLGAALVWWALSSGMDKSYENECEHYKSPQPPSYCKKSS